MAEFKIPTIDDTSRDFEGIRDMMIQLVPFFTPEWTDLNPSDFGVVLIELFAASQDILHFNVDRKLREGFLTTATSRKSVINLLKLIDFELRSAVPAQVDLVFTLGAVQTGPVLIPEGTKVKTVADETTPAVTFETTADLTIPTGDLGDETDLSGNFILTVGAIEGITGTEPVGTSDGTSFQEFTLDAVPIISGTLVILIDESGGDVIWASVNSFSGTLPTDLVYTEERDEADRTTIRFGDNGNGKIPVSLSPIIGQFRTGGGEIGNVGANTIRTVDDTILFGGQPITVSVNNPVSAAGGEERQSIDEAKRLGPLSLRALGRAVSEQDYKTLAEQEGGIAKARVVAGALPLEVDLFIVPTGGGPPSVSLLDSITATLEDINCVGTIIDAQGPTFVTIEIEGLVQVLPNFLNSDVVTNVTTAVEGFFDESEDDIDFGKDVRESDVTRVIEVTDGVDFVEYTRFTRTPDVVFNVKSGDYTVSAITINKESVTETWTVRFVNTTDFTVEGTVSGLQVATGTLDTPYTSDLGEVSFTVTFVTTSPALGDNFSFKTSPLIGSVLLSDNEFALLGDLSNLTITGGAETLG